MSLINFRKNCKKRDHVLLAPPLPIRNGQKEFDFGINADDYILNHWYCAYFYVILNVTKADGTAYGAGDVIALTSDASAMPQKLTIKPNGRDFFNVNGLNYYMTNTNLLEYTNEYAKNAGQMSFFYCNKIRSTDITKYTVDATSKAVESDNATYNENYHKRMIMTKAGKIHCTIEVKNCEFSASLYDQVLPPSNLDIKLTIDSDTILLHKRQAWQN